MTIRYSKLICKHDSDSLSQIYREREYKYPKFFKMDNLSKTGFLLAEELLDEFPDMENRKKISVICYNSLSSIVTDRNFANTIHKEEYFPLPSLFVYTLPNIVTGELCIRYKFEGESSFYVSQCFSASLMVNQITDCINLGSDAVLTMWHEIVDDNIKAVMFYVTKDNLKEFTTENVKNIYKQL